MKRIVIILAVVLASFFAFRACNTSPEEASKDTVKEFMSANKGKEKGLKRYLGLKPGPF